MPSIAFDHIALAMPRMTDAVPFLVGVLGGAPHSGMRGGPEIEVIEPVGADGFVHRFLAARGPGIHHVTFKVPSLDAACERARARGYDIVGYDDSYPDWKTAFLHPKQALGIVVQFAQTSGGTGPRRWTPPATVENPPPPVRVLGVRMRVSSVERARVQWEEILKAHRADGGTPLATDRHGGAPALVYRWPGSPMALTIDVDPTAAEGPMAIELTATRPVAPPAGPVPELGTTFRLARP